MATYTTAPQPCLARDATFLEAYTDRVANHGSHLESVANRLVQIADRTFGPAPCDPKDPAPAPPPCHAVGKLESAQSYVERLLSAIEDTVARLERL